MNKEIIRKLLEIQKKLDLENNGFPKNSCSLASKVVYDELGFLPYSGFVLVNNQVVKHSWNETSENEIIDLSLYQFNNQYPKIIYSSRKSIEGKWKYFFNKKNTSSLRKYIKNFDESFFKI